MSDSKAIHYTHTHIHPYMRCKHFYIILAHKSIYTNIMAKFAFDWYYFWGYHLKGIEKLCCALIPVACARWRRWFYFILKERIHGYWTAISMALYGGSKGSIIRAFYIRNSCYQFQINNLIICRIYFLRLKQKKKEKRRKCYHSKLMLLKCKVNNNSHVCSYIIINELSNPFISLFIYSIKHFY